MKKKKVILDCDPGSDDAVAILLALFSDKIDLQAITTVNGNRIVPKTTENALRVVQFMTPKSPSTAAVKILLSATRSQRANQTCHE